MSEEKIYLIPKGELTHPIGQKIHFRDVANLCPEKNTDMILDVVIHDGSGNEALELIKVEQLLDIAQKAKPQIHFELCSIEDVLINFEDEKKSKTPLNFLFNAIIYLMLFLGSALSVMYFHIDVGMKDAHLEFVRIFGGGTELGYKIIAVTYSIGLTAGIIFYFQNRKLSGTRLPSPVEIKMSTYDSGVSAYLKEKLKGKQKKGDEK
ncbi:MAG: hypothetical protein FWG10_12775 [Eubacteriaceae bacterium]|nr:hypothetical protein [Eubacteriaceae bacterium]